MGTLLRFLLVFFSLSFAPAIFAVTYPTTTPFGETPGGAFQTYFDNMYLTTQCNSIGRVVGGFTSTGVPICIIPAAGGISLTGGLGYTIYHNGTTWVSSPNIYNANGNVGIGTSSPGAKLEINGQIKITGGSPGNNKVLLSDTFGLASWSNVPMPCVPGGSGAGNTCYGIGSLTSNTTGSFNTANGETAMYTNTTGYQNSAFGIIALYSNLTGYQNSAFGMHSLYNNTSGYHNSAFGMQALYSNLTGYQNSAFGMQALFGTTGQQNTAIGYSAGSLLTSGNNNIFIGYNVQPNISNTASNQLNIGNWIYGNNGNIGIGATNPGAKLEVNGQIKITGGSPGANKVLTSDATGLATWGNSPVPCVPGGPGTANTCYGVASLGINTNGTQNTAYGYNTLYSNDFGYKNVAVGDSALYTNYNGTDNTAVGSNALYSNTSGRENTGLGSDTLNKNTSGNYNSSLGFATLKANTTGGYNTAVGHKSLTANTTGNQNTAVGISSLGANTTGSWNTAMGVNALQVNTSGMFNSAYGVYSLFSLTSGSNNASLGYATLQSLTSGSYNTAIGDGAGSSLTSGNSNIFIGPNAQPNISNTASNQLNIGNWIYGNNGNIGIGATNPGAKLEINGQVKITGGSPGVGKVLVSDATGLATWSTASPNPCVPGGSGVYNTCYGIQALASNTSGDYNTANGYYSLANNTTGMFNVAYAYGSLGSNTSGSYNTALGFQALSSNTTAIYNTALGFRTLMQNTSGAGNVAVGTEVLTANTSGNYNSAVGHYSLFANTTGVYNAAIGAYALTANTSGNYNSANGYGALYGNTSGSNNSAQGFFSLFSNTTGSDNVAIGYTALRNATNGNYNTVLGDAAGYNLTSGNNNIFIGYNVQPNISNTASNQLNIGNWIYGNNGNIGIGVLNPARKLEVGGQVNAGSGLCINNECINTWSGLNNIVKSAGTPNYIAKFNSGGYIDNSAIYETGGRIYIGNITGIIGGGATAGYITIESPTSTNSANPFLTLSENGGQECRMWITGSNKIGSNCTWSAGATGYGFQPYQIPRADDTGDSLTGTNMYSIGNNLGIGTGTNINTRVVIDSGINNDSGLRLARINPTSPLTTNGVVALGVDSGGKVLPISPISNIAVYTGVLRTTSLSPNPDINNFEVTYDFNKYFDIPGKQSFVVSKGDGPSNNGPYFRENGASALCSWNGGYGSSPYDCVTNGPDGLSASPYNSFTMTAKGDTFGYQIALGARGDAPLFARSGRYNGSVSNGLYTNDSPYQTPAPWQKVLSVPANHPEYFYINTGLNSQLQAISGGGNVGIGTTTPQSRFEVWTGSTTTVLQHFRGSNVGLGLGAVRVLSTGTANAGFGNNAMRSLTTGYNNAAFGDSALYGNTTGYFNTAGGSQALYGNAGGNWNTALGTQASWTNLGGSYNVAVGGQALYSNSANSDNIAIGYQSLRLATSDDNVALGSNAGSSLTTGGSNIFIGYNVQPNIGATASSQLNIGDWIYGNAGNIGIGVANPGAKFDVGGTFKLGTSGVALNAIVKSSVTVDVPSINSGACLAQTFTVANAAVGGSVVISPASALTDRMVIAYARVSAAGTVEAKFCNESAAAINLASMQYHITVIQ